VKDLLLKYIIDKFGSDRLIEDRTQHYSYCSFPELDCSCKDLNDINEDTSLITGGYIDSFSMVSVLIYIEKTFNVKISGKDATPANFDTVNKMVQLINSVK
jgi:acyl carrier protein